MKFTSKEDVARIRISSEQQNSTVRYSISDNGVGFEMDYVDKVFGVFQRLHSTRDFEGTGVGLAIVQRVILRHGGRVSAEGKTGEGAIFSFTLPHKPIHSPDNAEK